MATSYSISIYRLTEGFPKSEIFGLTSQLRRAGVSIPSNIAEGSGGSSTRDFCHYLDIAIKSTLETVSQLNIAKSLGYISEEKYLELYLYSELLVKKIRALKTYLKKSQSPRSTLHPETEVTYG